MLEEVWYIINAIPSPWGYDNSILFQIYMDASADDYECPTVVTDKSHGSCGQSRFGCWVCTMVVENISLPEEVEKALDERTKLGVMSDKMGTYMQYQAGQAMTEAAKNPNGNNFAGMGVGLGAGVGIGQAFAGGVSQAVDTPRVAPAKDSEAKAGGEVECPKCHAKVAKGAKFCPECGTKMPTTKFCPECGAKVAEGAKFCPECGTKLK